MLRKSHSALYRAPTKEEGRHMYNIEEQKKRGELDFVSFLDAFWQIEPSSGGKIIYKNNVII